MSRNRLRHSETKSSRFWRVFHIARGSKDHPVALLCVGMIVCGLIAWAFDLAGAWEIFGIGAMVAGAAVLVSTILG